jgi:hypothetical protein
MNAPGYNEWLDLYTAGGFLHVEGWVDGRLIPVLKILNKLQNKFGVHGGALEIGVHHGRFFIPLNGMAEQAQCSFAVDLFDEQSLNIDHSGQGSKSHFIDNLRQYDRHGGLNVECMQADSTRLGHSDYLRIQTAAPKVISIDGGHTVEHTLSDMSFAAQVVNPKGVIFVDDILNQHWIGVIEGVVTFLQRRPTIWPILLGYNKMLFAPMSMHQAYLTELRTELPNAKSVTLCGYPLLAIG